MVTNNLRPYDIVRITNPDHKWYGVLCLVVGSDVFGLGVYAVVQMEGEPGVLPTAVSIILSKDEYEFVGSNLIPKQVPREQKPT